MSKACVRAVNNFSFISSITKIKKSNGDLTYVEACNLSLKSVKIVQIRLKELDLYPFAIDGIAGKGTLSAINKAKSKIGSKASVGECVTEQDIAEFQKLARRLDLAEKSSVKANGCTIYKLQNCTNEQICGYATFNENGSVSWPANSFWTKRAKEMRLNCGVASKPVVAAKLLTCDDDPALCSVVQLCQRATLSKDGEKVWSGDAKTTSYVDLAKSTGVTCGVKPKPVVVAKLPTCDDDPALCSVVQLCQKATLSKDGEKIWSGDAKSTSYVELAKSTGVTCGVIEKPVVVAESANCSTDPSKCSMIELCAKASGTSAAGEKFWRMDAEFQSYVDMAKIIGVTCGVAPTQIQMVQVDTCETNASKCSMIDLCAKASGTTSSGEKFWRLDAEFQEYVNAAKTIGVTCGVQQAAVASSQPVTVIKPQKAQKYTNRKALVIGNANYLDQTPLKNPINDAKAVAAKLEQVGFEVTYKEDLGVREFGRTLSAYERSLSGSDMSLFYYAGHGIEINKQNYLIPVDAEITAPEDAQYETVMLDQAISASLNTGRLSMVLIDACRDNPFSGKMSGGTRSVGRGLSIVEVEKGSVNQIISFAASSGEVAEDGSGQNSPYASAIIDLLDEPNLEIGKMFRLVRDRVTQATGGKQKPVVNQDLSGEDIFLVVE